MFMIKKIIYFATSCFLIFSAWGSESLPLEFEKTFLYKQDKILVKSEKKELTNVVVKIFRGEKIIFYYEGRILEKRLRRLKLVSHLLFLFWKTGGHGETLAVLDIDKKKVIWEKFSTWPMEITVEKDKVRIDYTGSRLTMDKYEEFTKIVYINEK